MSGRLLVALISICVLSLVPSRASAIPCHGRDSTSAEIIDYLQELVSSPEASVADIRQGLGLVGVRARSVRLVSDTLVCTRLRQALDSMFTDLPTDVIPPVVVRVGPRYVVFLPNVDRTSQRQFEYSGVLHYFDLAFVYKESVLY